MPPNLVRFVYSVNRPEKFWLQHHCHPKSRSHLVHFMLNFQVVNELLSPDLDIRTIEFVMRFQTGSTVQYHWANLSGLFSFFFRPLYIYLWKKCSLILNRSPWIMESSPVYRISNLSIIRYDLSETFARLCVYVFGYCFAVFFYFLFIHIYYNSYFKRTSTSLLFLPWETTKISSSTKQKHEHAWNISSKLTVIILNRLQMF